MTQQPLPCMLPDSDWRPTPVGELPDWPVHGRVCVDEETNDPDLRRLGPGVRRGGYVVGTSFAIEDGPSHYLPTRHAGGDNLPEEHVWAYLRRQAERFRGTLVGANLGYDLDYLAENGVVFRNVKWFRDVQVAEPLINELQDGLSLEAICGRYGLPGKDERLLRMAAEEYRVHPKLGLWELPARYVAAYGMGDVEQPLQLLRKQERIIDEQDLWEIYDLESRVLPILVKLRRRGVAINVGQLGKIEDWSVVQEREELAKVYDLTGVHIGVGDTNKKELLAKALMHIGVELQMTDGGKTKRKRQYKIDAAVLEGIDHPVAHALLRAKKVAKLRTTFCKSIREHMINGRIHCTFHQLRRTKDDASGDEKGARYGRLSSSDPNLQQQPIRGKVAASWRSIYIPDEGLQWACLDYSQQEPRWTHHYAELSGCKGARAAAQRYRDDPNLDNHQMLADLVGIERTPAKIIYLGLTYGMGGAKMCRDLRLPTKWIRSRRTGRQMEVAGAEGESLFVQFHSEAPYLKQLAYKCSARAKKMGYILTVKGRRCRFPQDEDGNYEWTHKALNRLIQGSSADQTKQAMVDVDAAGHKIQLQIHDELDQSVRDRAHAEEIAEIMCNCVEINVPMKVDVGIGANWGEAK